MRFGERRSDNSNVSTYWDYPSDSFVHEVDVTPPLVRVRTPKLSSLTANNLRELQKSAISFSDAQWALQNMEATMNTGKAYVAPLPPLPEPVTAVPQSASRPRLRTWALRAIGWTIFLLSLSGLIASITR